MSNTKMINYDRIYVSEGIYVIRQAHKKSVIFVTVGIF